MNNAPIAATAGKLYEALCDYIEANRTDDPIYVSPGGGCLHDGKGHEVASLNRHVHLPPEDYEAQAADDARNAAHAAATPTEEDAP